MGMAKPELWRWQFKAQSNVRYIAYRQQWKSLPHGSFCYQSRFQQQAMPQLRSHRRLDGDGKPDLAVAHTAQTTFRYCDNTGAGGMYSIAGSFAARVDFCNRSQTTSVAIGDSGWRATRFGRWLFITPTAFGIRKYASRQAEVIAQVPLAGK